MSLAIAVFESNSALVEAEEGSKTATRKILVTDSLGIKKEELTSQ